MPFNVQKGTHKRRCNARNQENGMEYFEGFVSALEDVLVGLQRSDQLNVFTFVVMPTMMDDSFKSGMREAARASTLSMVQGRWSWKQRELDYAMRILDLVKREIA